MAFLPQGERIFGASDRVFEEFGTRARTSSDTFDPA